MCGLMGGELHDDGYQCVQLSDPLYCIFIVDKQEITAAESYGAWMCTDSRNMGCNRFMGGCCASGVYHLCPGQERCTCWSAGWVTKHNIK